ncbi:MAG: oligosaccharide flippase family protein [Desulfobulbus sp.]|nr:oligosaccharide flippase family protein [Desulfobulbus sp.]
MSKKLLLNSISGTTLYVVSVIIAFVMSPVYIKVLGNRDYGLWELVMSVVGYMGMLDLGIGGSLIRFVSVADGKRDWEDLQQTISTACAFFVIIGILAVGLFFVFSFSPELITGHETENISNLSTVFILLGINAAILFPLQVFTATLLGLQRHYLLNSVRIVLSITRAVVSYYLLLRHQDSGLIIMASLTLIFTAIQFVLVAGGTYLDRSIPRVAFAAVTKSKVKELLTFGAKSATMLVASRLQNQTVPLIIGHVLGLGHIVYFAMPNRLVDYAKGMSRAIGSPLAPYFGEAVGKGDHYGLKTSWLNTTLALQVVSLALPVIVFFCGETFLELWIGREYAVAGRVVLYTLLVGLVADSLAANAFSMLTALGKHGGGALMWLIFSIISIPAGICGGYLWGVAGVAAGTTLATVLANLITIYMTCAVMQISLITYFNKTFVRVCPALLVLIISLWILTTVLDWKSYICLMVQAIVSSVLYALALWQFSLSRAIKNKILCRIRLFFD